MGHCMFDLAQILHLTLIQAWNQFVSLPGLKPGIFHKYDKPVNHYAMKSL